MVSSDGCFSAPPSSPFPCLLLHTLGFAHLLLCACPIHNACASVPVSLRLCHLCLISNKCSFVYSAMCPVWLYRIKENSHTGVRPRRTFQLQGDYVPCGTTERSCSSFPCINASHYWLLSKNLWFTAEMGEMKVVRTCSVNIQFIFWFFPPQSSTVQSVFQFCWPR